MPVSPAIILSTGPRTATSWRNTWTGLWCRLRIEFSRVQKKAASEIGSEAAKSRPRLLVLRQHTNDCHHPKVLVREDVAVVDEVSDVHAAEVHEQLDLRG